jgi:hypothetical protein
MDKTKLAKLQAAAAANRIGERFFRVASRSTPHGRVHDNEQL